MFEGINQRQAGYFQSARTRSIYILLGGFFHFLFLVFELNTGLSSFLIYLRAWTAIFFIAVFFLLFTGYGKKAYQHVVLVCAIGHNLFCIAQYAYTGSLIYMMGTIIATIVAPVAMEMDLKRIWLMILMTVICFNSVALISSKSSFTELFNVDLFFLVASVMSIVMSTIFVRAIKNDYEKNIRLKEQGEVKSKILSVLSHDIRGPLNSIKGMFFLNDQAALTCHERKELEKKIKESIDSTIKLLENILEWSKSQVYGIAVNNKMFDLSVLTNQVLNIYKIQANEKGLRLVNKIPDSIMIDSDSSLVEMILRNLISNAIKFTKQGYVAVGCQLLGQSVEISVVDTGIGVGSSTLLTTVRNQSTLGTANEKGIGIGLALCKEYVTKLGGTISFKNNENDAGGSTFSFKIPKEVRV